MAVSPEALAQTLHRRREMSRRADAVHSERVAALFPQAAALLRDGFGATRVVLFGSSARGKARVDSDIDLAVQGVPARWKVAAAVALERLLRCTVDLVRIEGATPAMRATLAREGRAL